MSSLRGPVRFNGIEGTFSVELAPFGFRREICVDGIVMWDAFEDQMYWQSNFGSPKYRRPSPYSLTEASAWLEIWRSLADGVAGSTNEWRIITALGSTTVVLEAGHLRATTDAGNSTEYGPFELSYTSEPILLDTPERVDAVMDYDLTLRIPRTRVEIGGQMINVLLDSGSDHSIFDESLAKHIHKPKVKVGGVGGTVDFGLGAIEGLRIGDAMIGDVTGFLTSFKAMPGPLRMMKGIIGQDILGRGVMRIDRTAKRVVLTKEIDALLRWPLDGPYTPAVVDGEEGWYRIDTGSEFTIHKSVASDGRDTRLSHSGIGGSARVRPATFKDIRLDSAAFSSVPGFLAPESGDAPMIGGTIGVKLLQEMDVALDIASGFASFSKL